MMAPVPPTSMAHAASTAESPLVQASIGMPTCLTDTIIAA